MPEQDFRTELKAWMTGKRQKEAASILKVEIRTLQGWLAGVHEPYGGPTKGEILKRMKDHSSQTKQPA